MIGIDQAPAKGFASGLMLGARLRGSHAGAADSPKRRGAPPVSSARSRSLPFYRRSAPRNFLTARISRRMLPDRRSEDVGGSASTLTASHARQANGTRVPPPFCTESKLEHMQLGKKARSQSVESLSWASWGQHVVCTPPRQRLVNPPGNLGAAAAGLRNVDTNSGRTPLTIPQTCASPPASYDQMHLFIR